MRLSGKRRTGREGVIAARAFFESNDCVFQGVGLESGLGKGSLCRYRGGREALGLRDRSGSPISQQSFDKLLRNPICAGWSSYQCGALVSGASLNRPYPRICLCVRDTGSPATEPVAKPDLPRTQTFLSRSLSAASCAARGLSGSTSRGNGGRYAYYSCRVPGCWAVKFRRDDLHSRFVELLYSLTPIPASWRCLMRF